MHELVIVYISNVTNEYSQIQQSLNIPLNNLNIKTLHTLMPYI